MSEKIVFKSLAKTRTDVGSVIHDYSAVFATVFADVRDLRSSERYASQRLNAVMTKKILIRYMSGITPEMRVEIGGKMYDIDPPVDAAGKRKMLEIMATEVVSV